MGLHDPAVQMFPGKNGAGQLYTPIGQRSRTAPKEEEAVLQLKILRFPKETEEGWGRPTRIG